MGDNWMRDLPAVVTCLPLCQLKIPGSHDSGADLSLDSNLPVANDEGGVIAFLGKFHWVRTGIRRWAITQRMSVQDQLLCGVRYFDLRVSHPPEKLRGATGAFNLVHALYGPTVKEFLTNLGDFLDKHSKEVVLLDINHVFGMNPPARVRLKELIEDVLGKERLCPQMDPNECTLDFLWAHGHQVLVFMCRDDSGPFWSEYSMVSRWPEANRLNRLLPFLDRMLASDRPVNMHKFYVHQGVLTPKILDVILRWPSTLEKSLSLPATSSILSWMTSLPSPGLLNIVMVDFVSASFCSAVIQLNYSAIDQCDTISRSLKE